ncbi:hypothetical protein [Endozoicomonas acroporae]|uniref:hypothetical protein n=1 Tax=Endozoicomonas acroporae TaxID=1701104 RepID=UPI003D7AC2E5
MRFNSTEIVNFFSNVWKAASDKDIPPDQCQNCFNFSYRLVKTCVVAACCPKPSENDPAGLRKPLLPKTDQGVVAKQPDWNHMSESGPNLSVCFVGKYDAEAEGAVPYESFGGDSPEEPEGNYEPLVGDSPKPKEDYESLVDESPKLKENYDTLVVDLSQPEVNVTNEQLGVK